jgi:hypothetical protein
MDQGGMMGLEGLSDLFDDDAIIFNDEEGDGVGGECPPARDDYDESLFATIEETCGCGTNHK